MDSNSEIQGYNVYPMLHFRRKFSSGVTMGRVPRMGFEPRQDPSSLEMVNEFTGRMKSATKKAKSAICKV